MQCFPIYAVVERLLPMGPPPRLFVAGADGCQPHSGESGQCQDEEILGGAEEGEQVRIRNEEEP